MGNSPWLPTCICLAHRFKRLPDDDNNNNGTPNEKQHQQPTTHRSTRAVPEVPIDKFGCPGCKDNLEAIPGGDSLRYIDYLRSDEWEDRLRRISAEGGEEQKRGASMDMDGSWDWDREYAVTYYLHNVFESRGWVNAGDPLEG